MKSEAERIDICCGTEGYAQLVPYMDCEAGVCGADGVPVGVNYRCCSIWSLGRAR